jgi:hypothetical protein
MLSKSRCSHTGIVNYFERGDPLIAAGSIVKVGSSRYVWRSHIEDGEHGVASYPALAEACLYRALGADKTCRSRDSAPRGGPRQPRPAA